MLNGTSLTWFLKPCEWNKKISKGFSRKKNFYFFEIQTFLNFNKKFEILTIFFEFNFFLTSFQPFLCLTQENLTYVLRKISTKYFNKIFFFFFFTNIFSTFTSCSCSNNTRAWRTCWCHCHINSYRHLHCDFREDKTKGECCMKHNLNIL